MTSYLCICIHFILIHVITLKVSPVSWGLKTSTSTLGSTDVSYSLPALNPDKESAPNTLLFMEDREGIIRWLKRITEGWSSCVCQGHLKRGKHLPVKKRRGEKKKSTARLGAAGSTVSAGVVPLESLSCNWVNCWPPAQPASANHGKRKLVE